MTAPERVNESPAPDGVGLSQYRISREASAQIDTWSWQLADGTVRLWQLPDAICTLFYIGYEQGRSSRDAEVQQLRVDADRYWLRAFADKDKQEYLLSRLDQAADLANRPDVDDVLDETWRIYLASLDNLRDPVRITTTTEDQTKGAA